MERMLQWRKRKRERKREGMMLVCVGDDCLRTLAAKTSLRSDSKVQRRFMIRNIAVDRGQRD